MCAMYVADAVVPALVTIPLIRIYWPTVRRIIPLGLILCGVRLVWIICEGG